MLRFVRLSLFFVVPMCSQALAGSVQGDLAFLRGDYTTAYREWMQSVSSGDSSAMGAIGTLYDTGHGVQQDFGKALAWYRRAAEAGDVLAMGNVGSMYDNGRGAVVDRREAVRWYGMAAERGNGRAAYSLAVIYRDGDGVPRDHVAAVKFFRIAAGAGIRAAESNLAALHADTPRRTAPPKPLPSVMVPAISVMPVVPPAVQAPSPPVNLLVDPLTAAIARFQRAALARATSDAGSHVVPSALIQTLSSEAGRGNRLAQYDLGFAYERGIGVPADPVKSYVYYLRASLTPEKNISAPAIQGAMEMAKRLNADQHSAALGMLIEN